MNNYNHAESLVGVLASTSELFLWLSRNVSQDSVNFMAGVSHLQRSYLIQEAICWIPSLHYLGPRGSSKFKKPCGKFTNSFTFTSTPAFLQINANLQKS